MNQFDGKANLWDENPVHFKRSIAIASEIVKQIPLSKNLSAIEFGAGTAILSILLADQLKEIILIDNSREMLRVASEKIEREGIQNLHPLFFDLDEQSWSGPKANLLFSQMALHHVKNVENSLTQFYGMIEDGGYLAIADLYPEDGSFHGFEPNVYPGFDPDWLKLELERTGFSKVHYLKVFTIQKAMENASKDYPVFLIFGRK